MDDMQCQGQLWCSRCKAFRDNQSFETLKSGKVRKTCNRHGLKRELDIVFDDWDDFQAKLAAWNHHVCHFPSFTILLVTLSTILTEHSSQEQTEPLEVNCTFNMDRLPVSFGARLSQKEDGSYDRKPLNDSVGAIVDLIWKIGGFRFWHKRTHWEYLRYIYFCCQDAGRARESVAEGKQDSPRMDRFDCRSRLELRPSLEERTLAISISHSYHVPYFNSHLSSDVMEFIQERHATSTPAEIFREIQAARPQGWASVSAYQVYYQWQLVNSRIWRRDPDPLRSAQNLLQENTDVTSCSYCVDNVRGLALFISDSIRVLAPCAKELAMDATYGTNNAGVELFAVLAEVDGTGVPLAYCLVEVFEDNEKGERLAIPGAIRGVLCQLLQNLRASGFAPTFFGTDKDPSEISAVRETWPTATVQLCYWHVRRAIRTKLASSLKTNTQNEYKPGEVQVIIPDVEICWGSLPIRRPGAEHRYGGCSCPSRLQFSNVHPRATVGVKDKQEKEAVLTMFSTHFNVHPLIPDQNGTYRTAQQIHNDSAREMYSWCRSRDYFRLWAYMWINWYQPDKWALWARSANDKEIPVLKTTMIVESHWRRLKHDYLHRFNRPRIDLLVWVLLSRSIPVSLTRMQGILSQDPRQPVASWRKAFKQQWKRLTIRSQSVEDPRRYHANPVQWACGCPRFINSRFLICKHLVSCYEPIVDPIPFFRQVRRQRSPPFWVDEQLVLRPEFQPTENQDEHMSADTQMSQSDSDEIPNFETVDDGSSDSGAEGDTYPGTIDEDQLLSDSGDDNDGADDESDSDDEIAGFVSDAEKWLEIIKDQKAKGNHKFLKKVMTSTSGVQRLVQDVSSLERQRTMPRTWGSWKHPATMYFK